jgi:rod shape-determining protein MreC
VYNTPRMEHQPPEFFKRGPSALARLTFFGVCAVLLMVLDARFNYADGLRNTLALVINPLQRVAIAPVTAFNHISEFFSSRAELRRQNTLLRTDQLQTAQAVLTLQAIQAENEQLRALLRIRPQYGAEAMVAEIIYAGRDPFSRKVIIDKGEQEGIESGQPVIDTAGVVGQVTRVLPMLAEITLVTDKDHAIPVQVVRNGLRGIAYGSGDGYTLELRFMPANAEIQTGDVLVTSGLDGLYPRGLPVATVAKVERDASYAFAKISLTPSAGTDRYRQVLVLRSGDKLPPRPQEESKAGAKPPAVRKPQ